MRNCEGQYSSYALARVVRFTVETNMLTSTCLSIDSLSLPHPQFSRHYHPFVRSCFCVPRKLEGCRHAMADIIRLGSGLLHFPVRNLILSRKVRTY